MAAVSARELLVAARLVLDQPAAIDGSAWARSTALLARQALEMSLRDFWSQRAPGMEACSSASQLLALPFYVNDSRARAAHETWASLSHACHHHAYDLSPTAAELVSWLDATEAIVEALSGDPATAPTRP